jgi:kynurenine formamidase
MKEWGYGEWVDLTAPLGLETCVYPTDPPFKLSWEATFADGIYCCSKLEFGPHSGTHVDAPLHFIEGGSDIGSMAPDLFCGPAVIVEAPKKEGEDVVVADFAEADIRAGDIVLVHTGWDSRINTPALFEGSWPGFSPAVVEWLAGKGVKAIGFDSPSADSPAGLAAGAPAHLAALSRGMPIFETLANLGLVGGRRVAFFGLPLRIVACEASPIRALAFVE